jgi:hypothetical protein
MESLSDGLVLFADNSRSELLEELELEETLIST